MCKNRYLILCLFLVLVLSAAACSSGSSDSDDSDGSGDEQSNTSEFLSSTPVLDMDVQSQTLSENIVASNFSQAGRLRADVSASATEGDPSVGGCMAWSIRKNAINAAAVIQELSCAFQKMADEVPGFFDDDVNYIQISDYDDGNDLKVKIYLENNTATIKACVPHANGTNPTESNAEIVATHRDEGGYHVEGTWITTYPVDTNTGAEPVRYFEETLDSSSDGTETFSYFDYWVNETDAATCNGTSGTSNDTDDTCFIALSGSFYNDTNALNPYSTMSGSFAEKNNAGTRTVAAVYAHFANGQGQSRYSAALPAVTSDVNASTSTDIWSPQNFTIQSGVADKVDEVLPDRRTTLPSIDDKWDCSAEGDFVEIPISMAQPVISACRAKTMESADITSCTDSSEIDAALNTILNDPCDPLLSDQSSCTE